VQQVSRAIWSTSKMVPVLAFSEHRFWPNSAIETSTQQLY
jgi:hypothetical protein